MAELSNLKRARKSHPESIVADYRTVASGGHGIECLVYRPLDVADNLPVVLFLHGGGGIMLSPEDFDATSRMLADQVRALVVVPRYRRAPEHPFPQPLNDCIAVYRWLSEHAADWGGQADRIAVTGDSAGGYLAAAVVQAGKEEQVSRAVSSK